MNDRTPEIEKEDQLVEWKKFNAGSPKEILIAKIADILFVEGYASSYREAENLAGKIYALFRAEVEK
jgi:hypothetical protein